IRNSLRMRPDRIIVGEVRGAEALEMLQAMNTGHSGSMSTGHANSPEDMITRIETMILMGDTDLPLAAVRGQIASAINIVVHLGRLRDRQRKVLSIHEITGMEAGSVKMECLYRFCETGEANGKILGKMEKCGELVHTGKLREAGIL
ncbi:MAG: CpaF family protein, partial [Parasporobacterium sp.]|nr:CpaF family protein [Parasporobacterium sp.]